MKKKCLLVTIVLCMCLGLTGCKVTDYMNAIESFDIAEKSLEEKNTAYDDVIKAAEEVVRSEKIAYNEKLRSQLETAVSDAKTKKMDIKARPHALKDIESATKMMNQMDYTKDIEELKEHKKALEDSIAQYELVNAPDEKYIINCLKRTGHVVDISAATEDNDPNGNLHKPGGYTAQVYFSVDWVDQGQVDGATVIEKGTDCGGSIEVYENVEQAEKRRDYLATFDGGILANGSHTVVGTVLVRTSDLLNASQQKELEQLIIDELIRLEQ